MPKCLKIWEKEKKRASRENSRASWIKIWGSLLFSGFNNWRNLCDVILKKLIYVDMIHIRKS